ncbi:putative methyltransferase-like protein 24 [Saccoglossus kowalevskii]|uniref:Methyltransferase-like protein 24-like n=1 Tax=Saccoglossus kowalevskii TaxID=10224 RepID=A0ABM0MQT2_SACKO|nr:PREDICTED: methyltransferase-like protein 24-like [Saccoglossus kowalevskii]
MLLHLPRSTMKRTVLALKLILFTSCAMLYLFTLDFKDNRMVDIEHNDNIIVVDTEGQTRKGRKGMDFMYIDTEDAQKTKSLSMLSGRVLNSVNALVLQPWAESDKSIDAEADRFLTYITTIQMNCRNIIDIGYVIPSTTNSSWPWRVCYDSNHVGREYQSEDMSCLVYSFGTNPQDRTFDLELLDRGCEVHVFSPTTKTVGKSASNERMVFHKTSLDWRDTMMNPHVASSWRTRRLSGIMSDLGHTEIDILRANLESSEWKVLENIVAEGTSQRIQQLIIKIHLHWGGFEVTGSDADVVRFWYSVFKQLENSGFRLFSSVKDTRAQQKFLGHERYNASSVYTLSWLNTRWTAYGEYG